VGPVRMALTGRGGGALAGALVVLLFAFYAANILLFVVAVFLVGFVLAELLSFAFATRGFGTDGFTADRVECSSFVGVGGTGFVSVRLSSHLAGSFFAELFDAHSDRLGLVEGEPRLLTWWPPSSTLRLAYVVSPKIRGLFTLGPVKVVAHDPLGLAFKSVELESLWPLEAISQPWSRGLENPVRLRSTVVGQTSVSTPGGGTDFRALRDYEVGDELRHIAWSRSTQGKLYVRQYERESQQDLVVLLDGGREMAMGGAYEDALEKAVPAAAEALRRSFDEGGRGGVVVFDRDVRAFDPPGRGVAHEFRVFRTVTGAQVGPRPAAFDTMLEYVVPRLRRPTSLLAFSSLGGDPSKFAAAVGAVREAGHRLSVLVPDARSMYAPIQDPTGREALELLIGPEVARTQRAVETLARAGASVRMFGREGATDVVSRLYAEGRLRPEAA
jgi:uncharacterized protein (DUF58 family)